MVSLNPVWQKASAGNDFKLFAPGLREMIELQKEIAADRHLHSY